MPEYNIESLFEESVKSKESKETLYRIETRQRIKDALTVFGFGRIYAEDSAMKAAIDSKLDFADLTLSFKDCELYLEQVIIDGFPFMDSYIISVDGVSCNPRQVEHMDEVADIIKSIRKSRTKREKRGNSFFGRILNFITKKSLKHEKT